MRNASTLELTISFDSQSRVVLPGKTKKIRALHYHASVTFTSGGTSSSYSHSLAKGPDNWNSYYPGYVCQKSLGMRIDLTYTEKRELVLEPCDDTHPRKLLPPDIAS